MVCTWLSNDQVRRCLRFGFNIVGNDMYSHLVSQALQLSRLVGSVPSTPSHIGRKRWSNLHHSRWASRSSRNKWSQWKKMRSGLSLSFTNVVWSINPSLCSLDQHRYLRFSMVPYDYTRNLRLYQQARFHNRETVSHPCSYLFEQARHTPRYVFRRQAHEYYSRASFTWNCRFSHQLLLRCQPFFLAHTPWWIRGWVYQDLERRPCMFEWQQLGRSMCRLFALEE